MPICEFPNICFDVEILFFAMEHSKGKLLLHKFAEEGFPIG
jgi:hypothetical protein